MICNLQIIIKEKKVVLGYFIFCTQLHLVTTKTHNLLLLAEEGMALQSFTELTLWDVGKDFILSFISCAVGDSTEKKTKQ